MLRLRAESRVVEVEKQCSMLEFDLKQSVQKMEQLMKQKDRLEDEVRMQEHHIQPKTCRSSTPWCDVCDVCVCVLQVKSLRVQLEQECGKRAMAQSEMKTWCGEAERLRGTEKQLKQEINSALETKRSLEFQLAQLSK